MLRTFFIPRRRRGSANGGFVLPTVVMVSIVVVLLTAAILFRSFERSKNASNVRVNEVVIKAASPALDRAKAKINELFQDNRLPRSTPSDLSLTGVINSSIDKYTFGDETPLKLVKEVDEIQSNYSIKKVLKNLNSVWKYPVDTDNNGLFDSLTIYGIYFQTPPIITKPDKTTVTTPRSPLEARTQPMDEGATSSSCGVGTSADLVGSQGWYKVGSKLKRSIFVYTTTVPITDIKTAGLDDKKYELFKGNKGFAALEYQQDRERIPLSNNAVIYDNDLEIAPGAGLNLNGRIFTNGNLLTRKPGTEIRFYLVSSPKSCYYTEENSKIVVAGNVINSRVNETAAGSGVKADLFDKNYNVDTLTKVSQGDINNTNKTVPASIYGNTAAYNDEAYARRIDRLVKAAEAAIDASTLVLPDEVKQAIDRSLAADASLKEFDVRKEQLKIYFKKRTRRVPFAEIAFNDDALKYGSEDYISNSPLEGDGNSLRPVDKWVFPFAPADGTTETGYANIGIYNSSITNKIYLTATDPAEQVKAGKENKIGDRVLVGNNMPQLWYDSTKKAFVSSPEQGQTISGKEWDVQQNGSTNSTVTRKRYSQAYQLDNLGVTDRDDFWEKAAAQKPASSLDVVGGLRVITGAGIYLPKDYNTTTKAFTNTEKVIWPDSMPMGVTTKEQGLPNGNTPYLQMRATAVYHYQDYPYDPKTPGTYQTPIACVSSFYDPTIKYKYKDKDKDGKDIEVEVDTAKNASKDAAGNDLPNGTATGKSNNGVVYSASDLATTGYTSVLSYQAELKYPHGRLVNELLDTALKKIKDSKNLTLSEQSAVDSSMCALKILDGSIGAPTTDKVPHNAIRETAFLDARQIKAIDKPISASEKTYDLNIELRQPLEIRATILDLDLLRKKSKTGGEFLFPNSGIIYATRDDALADQSNATSQDVSATDFKLDPTRRPNGIMLINGSDLSRNDTYKAEEKGLILASNLPVYIQGDFNKHTKEEFTQLNTWGIDFYKRKTLDTNFACRAKQFTNCSTGESWRPATVIADAITVLSSNFQLGYRQDGDYDLNDNYGGYFLGYDVDGISNINPATTVSLNEQNIRFDLDGDGTINSATNVSLTEDKITATVAARLNGFWDNNFVTSRNFDDSKYSSALNTDITKNPRGSSYFNNFVTPVQRRIKFSEYVMEICPKRTVTACQPGDWVVGYDLDGNGTFSAGEKGIKANQLVKALSDASITSIQTNKLWAGTTATAPSDSSDTPIQSYPRRVAFLRYTSGLTVKKGTTTLTGLENTLVLDPESATVKSPVPLGIFDQDNDPASTNDITIKYFPFSNTLTINSVPYNKYATTAVADPPTNPAPNRPRTQSNALWFRTKGTKYNFTLPLNIENTLTGTRTTEQPLLAPVLQIQFPSNSEAKDSLGPEGDGTSLNWMQRAVETETNLVFAQGNTPERPIVDSKVDIGESNGGLENFVRYLETWDLEAGANTDAANTLIKHKASGSFIQFKRSSYATAPWQTLIAKSTSPSNRIFNYRQEYAQTTTNSVDTPFYAAPSRGWGFDVALLTQLPDLFSQRFTAPTLNPPNEFYREVGRDDNWVKTLLCAAQKETKGYGTADSTKYGTGYKYAISSDQRPTCP